MSSAHRLRTEDRHDPVQNAVKAHHAGIAALETANRCVPADPLTVSDIDLATFIEALDVASSRFCLLRIYRHNIATKAKLR